MLKVIKRLLKHDKRFLVSFSIISIFIVLAIISLFATHDLTEWNVFERDLPMSWQHPLGTNSMGQDIMWKAMASIRNTFIISVVALIISRIIAISLGLFAGYKGGYVEKVLMTINDSFVIIPLFPILILVSTVLGGSVEVYKLGIILGLLGWSRSARVYHSQILSVKERAFTKTALQSGMSTYKIISREHLPYIFPLIMATSINNMIWIIGMEVTLSILGLANLSIPTLGTMIHWALDYQAIFLNSWNWILTPVILVISLIISLFFMSTSVSEYLDPRTRVKMLRGDE
ncbi:MAG: ABC transporter permease [Halothermotrichaceae bacterium]